MKAHEKSDQHIQANLASEGALRAGSIVQQLQGVDRQERAKNRAAIKSLIRCTQFLARNHIAHTTNFDKMVDLVVSCGGEDLGYFLEKTGKNATYTSHIAVVEFVEALGIWVEESLLKVYTMHPITALWLMSAPIFQLWKSCPYSAAGWKMVCLWSISWK